MSANQHRKIKGYRELSEDEIASMNAIKVATKNLLNEIEKASAAIKKQQDELLVESDTAADKEDREFAVEELERIQSAEPHRWLAMAKTSAQQASMYAVRGVAQPKD